MDGFQWDFKCCRVAGATLLFKGILIFIYIPDLCNAFLFYAYLDNLLLFCCLGDMLLCVCIIPCYLDIGPQMSRF